MVNQAFNPFKEKSYTTKSVGMVFPRQDNECCDPSFFFFSLAGVGTDKEGERES